MNRTGLLRATGNLYMKWIFSAGLLVLILSFPFGEVRGSNSAQEWQSHISQIEAHSEYQAAFGSLTPGTFLFQDPSPDTPDESLTQVTDPRGDMSPLLVAIVVLVVLGTALLLAVSLLRRETDS
jgi:hypothetical protein